MGDTILRVDDIQKFYGNKGNLTKAIDHISFSVRKGEFLGIMGASGSGKTTLLNCISTIDTVTSGHIYVEEKDITMLHRAQLADFRGKKLGFIFQNFNLLDTLTAYENISLALSIAGAKPSEIEQRIPQIAQALNIQDARHEKRAYFPVVCRRNALCWHHCAGHRIAFGLFLFARVFFDCIAAFCNQS